MPTVFVKARGCQPEHCYVDRVPVPGEVIELSDGTIAQVTTVTHTPYRQGLAAVLGGGLVENPGRVKAEIDRIHEALQPR